MKLIIKGRFSQWIVFLVVLGLLLQPVQRVLAAESVVSEAPVSDSQPSSEPTSVETPDSLSSVEPTDPAGKTAEETTDTATDDTEQKTEEQTSTEVIPEPPVVPAIQLPASTVKQKTADADVASGALVYGYQFQIPSGRSGLQPGLSLSYNSQQNEEGSLVGYGWGLDIPSIERKNVNGINKLYTSNNFTSSVSGDLKKIGNNGGIGAFGAKLDNGSFLKYEFSDQGAGGVWTVRDKSGLVYTYGQTSESRLSNPTDATKVFRWNLTRVEDAKGNFVSYEYTKIDNQVYPTTVRYTGKGTDQGIYKVQFALEDRADKVMSAKYGFMVTTTKRLAEVQVFLQNTQIGKYSLDYNQQPVNTRSLLSNIEYKGFDSSGANGISDGGMDFKYESIGATNLLTKIIQNTGGVTLVTYKSSAQYRDGSVNALNPNLPFAIQTVEKIQYDDRNGVEWQNSFEYAGGWFYYNGPMDRRFVGFEKVVRTDAAGNTVSTFYHQGNGNNLSYGEANDDWAKVGKSYKSELRDSQGNLYTQVFNKWEFNRLPGVNGANDRSFAKLSATVTRTFDGDTSHKDIASTYSYDSDTGNLISGVDFGKVDATDSGSFTDVGEDKLTTNVSYASPTISESMLGFASGFIELDQSGAKVKEGKSYYDGLAFGQVGTGNPTKEESWISGTTYASVSRTFNSYGLVETETDPLSHVTTYGYDSFNLYPITVTNALSQVVTYEYDYRIGKPFKTLDPNGLLNKVTYDGLGRAVKEEFTKSGQTDSNVLFTKKSASYELYEQGGEVRGWKTVETNYLDEVGASAPRENKLVTYTDGFDRVIQTRALVESADATPSDARYSVSDTVYNNIAQIAKTSLPYFSVGDARTTVTTDNNLFATLSYDTAYRVTATTNVLGTSSNAYDDWKVTLTDADGKVKALYKDAFDRLVKVDEHNGTEIYTTNYSYDAEGNLTKIEDALGNERSFEYDGLGRRTSAEDLHAPSDATFGVWTYSYDLAGNLESRTDANGTEVGYGYDALNRVISEAPKKSDGVTYSYDNCPKGIGRLCSVTNSAVVSNNEYDVLGQLVKETKTINNQAYVTEYTYDRQGNQLVIKNPDSSEIKYSYNIGGAIETVQSRENGASSFGNVIVDIDYAPTGAIAYRQQANGARVTNTYDATKLYRLTLKVGILPLSGGGIKTVQNYAYSYDAVGNITQIADTSELNTSKITLYTYDDLHRLTWAHTIHAISGQNYSQIYAYDAIGNITSKSDVGTYSYDGDQGASFANPHAVTSITTSTSTTTYSYDQNGNVLNDSSATYDWDYNNRISSITPDGVISNPINYGYDAAGMRVSVSSSAATTVYPSQFYNTSGAVSGAGVQKHIFAGDSVVATIKGSGVGATLSAMHSDHLGSTMVVSDASGAIAETVDYYPFGSLRHDATASGTPEQRKFIGQEYDAETELSYLEARYYDPNLGRFLSEDAVHLSMGDSRSIKQVTGQELQEFLRDPQGFNSYGYARNNPINFRDPNGEFWGKLVDYLSKAGYASSAYFQRMYDNNSWKQNPGAKLGSYLLTDAFKQQGVALDKNAPAKDRVVAGVLLTSNFIPGPKGAGKIAGPLKETILLERALLIGRAASTGDSEVLKIVEKLYQASDDVLGGTAGALIHEKNTGELLSKSATGHLQAAQERVNWINNQLTRIGNSNPNATQLLNTLRQDLERAIYHKKL